MECHRLEKIRTADALSKRARKGVHSTRKEFGWISLDHVTPPDGLDTSKLTNAVAAIIATNTANPTPARARP
ncbi:hypothetical protein DSM25558_4638 [Agrobacterium sp. DSM 25558]|uniref:Uncharacterized protein n=1 Tax=Agrobacterium rosae TaxID=1972867 RepID=A0A1R3TZ15_9HYPH|nr:hypothetical protein DSM25558_4638 [Agrobacterium sp. DSM 25558]SCX32808.1 hypothetical protein DSM25559_4000 [Agrobacterium rosae]